MCFHKSTVVTAWRVDSRWAGQGAVGSMVSVTPGGSLNSEVITRSREGWTERKYLQDMVLGGQGGLLVPTAVLLNKHGVEQLQTYPEVPK